jgi:hypothetical protein
MPLLGERNGLWADALDPIVRFRFDLAFNRRPSLIDRLFNVQTSTRNYEQVSGVGAVGIEAWDAYRTSGIVGQADFDQGYKATYTHIEYPLEIQIKRALMDDTNMNQVLRIAERAGDSAAVKREIDAASVFNNAMSASFVGPDAVALCSDSHPWSPQKTGAVQDNKYALALSAANLSTIRTAMMLFVDDAGNPMGVTPDTILVPPALADTAYEATRSTNDPANANNTINAQNEAGRWNVIVWHYLTDTNRFFVIDSNLMRQSLDWFNRAPLTVVPKVEDKTLLATWIAYMRYSFGWSDYRWVVGSEPS